MRNKMRFWSRWTSLVVALSLSLAGCQALPGAGLWRRQSATVRKLVILYTNDEHGWMEPWQEAGGAGGMLWRWQNQHAYADGGPFLALSGGDMWTGPAVSTVTQGESMTEVMNVMGYDAAALGNHDFDFGLEALRGRANQASFPFLSANLRRRDSGEIPDFAQAYVVREVNGMRIGIIGLTTLETPVDTRPFYVQGFRFLSYAEALAEVVPSVRAEGADVYVVIGHVCNNELRELAESAERLGIPLLAGGHCHEEHVEQVDGVHLIESGYFLRGYVEAELYVDIERDQVVSISTALHPNPPGETLPEIEARIGGWKSRLDQSLWQPIGYTAQEIGRTSPEMARLLTEAWLNAVPEAQVVIASQRYVQQSIPAGEVSPAAVIGTLPVRNSLMLIDLTGEQLMQTIAARQPLVGGLEETQSGWLLDSGEQLQDEAVYSVIIPDILYYGGNYYQVQPYDLEPVDTGIDWRQPVIEWIDAAGTTAERPLDRLLASEE